MSRFSLVLVSIFLFSFSKAMAQNMVLTGDFETYTACPSDTAQIDYSPPYTSFPTAKGWVIPTAGTADFFDTCATGNVDVPQNQYGYQQGHTPGGYVGLHTFLDSGYSKGEYVETRLTQAMTSGHDYYMKFYVSYTAWNANVNFVAVDSMGLYLSDTMVNDFSAPYLSFVPNLASPAGDFINDTVAWKKVEGFYTAAGGEQWAILGKFITHTPVSHVSVYNNGPFAQAAYMYIDDVCITDITNPVPLATIDTIVCTSGFPITLHSTELQDDYVQWNTGDTTHDLVINDTGTYWFLKVSSCIAYTDTIKVHPKTIMDTVANPLIDTTVCAEAYPFTLQCSHPGDSILWNTGATTSSIAAADTGLYIVSSLIDCTYYIDSFRLGRFPVPVPVITQLDSFLTTGNFVTYQWNLNHNPVNGANSQTYIATQSGIYNVTVTDANGCTGISDTVTVTVTTGVGNVNSPVHIYLAPNPAHDELEVYGDISGDMMLSIDDISGRVLLSQALSKGRRVVINMLAPGIYLFHVSRAGIPVAHGKLIRE